MKNMKKIKFIKNNYEKKKQDKLISSTLNGYLLLIIIFCSIVLSIFIYKSNDWLSLKLDNTMTGYIAIIGSLPTVYLWIVRERKKEEELKNKQQEINQIKISELNKVYVDAVNQFFDAKTFIAGAYALLALVDDWINMSREYNQKVKDYYPRVSQISLIIFSAQKDNYENKLFTSIINELLQKIISLEKNSEDFSFNWSKVSLNNLSHFNLNLSNVKLSSIEIEHSDLSLIDMTNAVLINAQLNFNNFNVGKLTGAQLIFAKLNGSSFIGAELPQANFTGAELINADLTGADLSGARLVGADLTGANLTEANLVGTDLSGADLTGANLTDAVLIDTVLIDTVLTGTILAGTDLIENS